MTAHDDLGSVVGSARKRLAEGSAVDGCAVCAEWETQYNAAMEHVEKLRDIFARVKALVENARIERGHRSGRTAEQQFREALLAALSSPEPAVSTRSEGVDVDLSGILSSNALCVAADERGFAYAVEGATDEQLAQADADFVTAVEHVVGTYAALSAPVPDFGNERPAAEEAAGSSSNDAHTAPVPDVAAERVAAIKTHNGTPETAENLRWPATHEALCRSWTFDVLTGLADLLDEGAALTSEQPDDRSGR